MMGIVYVSYSLCLGLLSAFVVAVVLAYNKSKHMLREVLKNEKKT